MKYEYEATLARVIDGDTVVLKVDLGFKIEFEVTFMLLGIDAPEREAATMEAGNAAKEYLIQLLTSHPLKIETLKDKKDKYGRYLVTLYTDSSTVSINEEMVKAGHAVRVES